MIRLRMQSYEASVDWLIQYVHFYSVPVNISSKGLNNKKREK